MSTSINEEQQYISFNSTGSNNTSANLPSMSKDKYVTTYENFLQGKKPTTFSEMILLYFLTITIAVVLSSERTLIQTTTGPIKGTYIDSFGVQYFSFQGIPYAEKPTGDLRFRPPVPKSPWTEVRDASHPGNVCPQTEGAYKKEEIDEDCLFLNVFVPANKTDELMSVFVYIPGGEFNSLSGNANHMYGPQLLLRLKNIIIVTLNYRLGALGFLSMEDEEASGNAGLKDILLALQWTNDNVEKFGGDRNKITIGGNSAGSVATQYLLLSNKSVGLFNQAILISGSALGYRFLARNPKEIALMLAKELGIPSTGPQVLAKLKEADALDIVKAQEALGTNDTRNGFRPFAPFVPCIEIDNPSAFLTEDPLNILKAGIPNKVPILAGFNTDEGLKMYTTIKKNQQLVDYLNEDFQLCIPSDIGYPYGSEASMDLAKSIQKFYFDDASISEATIQNFTNLITDTMFAHSITYAMQLYKEKADSKELYFYVFGFDGQLNYLKIKNKIDRPGTAHADELGYLFVTDVTKPILCNLDNRSHPMLDVMTSIMTNFVKFGTPTPENNIIGIDWMESTKELNHLYIDEQIQYIDTSPIPERLQFWQDVYDQYYLYMENGGAIEYNLFP